VKQNQISRTQLMSLLWAGLMAPAAEWLPGLLLPQAGKGAWLSVLAAAPLVLGAGWLLERVSAKQGLAAAMQESFGRGLGNFVLILYGLWGVLLLALRLRLCALRLAAGGIRDGSLWFFLLITAGLTLWIGRGKLPAIARAGQLFLAALLVTAAAVLGLSLSQVRLNRLVVPFGELPGILSGAVPTVGVLGWGMFAAFLLKDTADQGERKGWHWCFWGLGGCALLSLAQAVILGNLGAVLAGRLDGPFFALAKSVGIEGAFQRVESVVTSIWLFADLTLAGVLVFGVRSCGKAVWNRAKEPLIAGGAVLSAFLLALLPLWDRDTLAYWGGQIVPAGNLILGLGVPLVLLFQQKVTEGSKRGHISCGNKGKRPIDIVVEKEVEKKMKKGEKKS
jgi:hypothetical protein